MNGKIEEEKILSPIERKKKRLQMYYSREEYMLSQGGVQSYGIGSRNVARYNTELSDIRTQIKELEKEIYEMESKKKPRKAVAVVARDW